MLTLPILMYHQVDQVPQHPAYLGNYVLPEQFNAQLEALKQWGYTTVSLEDWLDFRAGRCKPPEKPIAITFDDGYMSNYEIAWPLLNRHAAVATIFLVANNIGETYHGNGDEPPIPFLNTAQIHRMQAGGIRFGSHTCTHRSLIDIPRRDALAELVDSREKLQGLLGRPVTALAYPYNKQNHGVRALVRRAGYQLAVLGRGRINSRLTSPWALSRIHVDVNMSIPRLKERLARKWWLLGF